MATQLALPSGERRADPSVAVYGVLALSIAVVVMMGGIFAAWLALRSGTTVWPPKGVKVDDYFGTVLSATALIAAFAGWWSVYAVRRNERRQAVGALGLVVMMELAFINLHTYMLRASHLSPRQNAFAVMYFAANIAVIAVWVIAIGVTVVALARVLGGQVHSAEPQLSWAAAWYATVVTIVWLVLFVLIYVVG